MCGYFFSFLKYFTHFVALFHPFILLLRVKSKGEGEEGQSHQEQQNALQRN